MIKVIEHGDCCYETRCKECGCRFMYTWCDTEISLVADDGIIKTVKCPECGTQIMHSSDNKVSM